MSSVGAYKNEYISYSSSINSINYSSVENSSSKHNSYYMNTGYINTFIDFIYGNIDFCCLLANTRFAMDKLFLLNKKKSNYYIISNHFVFLVLCDILDKDTFNNEYDYNEYCTDSDNECVIEYYKSRKYRATMLMRKLVSILWNHPIMTEYKDVVRTNSNVVIVDYDNDNNVIGIIDKRKEWHKENVLCHIMKCCDELIGLDDCVEKRFKYALMFIMAYDFEEFM